jgi:peptidoglycan/xylan/chitin deacetylase (PgdA/CDA1 family)
VDLIRLGSHTKTHPFLPKLSDEDAQNEIFLSRVKLEQMLGREFRLFAFPYGAFNDRLVRICREAGYSRVFTTLPYLAELTAEEFVSGRVTVEPTDWPVEFYLKLCGSYRWLPIAFSLKRKLKAPFTRNVMLDTPCVPNQARLAAKERIVQD